MREVKAEIEGATFEFDGECLKSNAPVWPTRGQWIGVATLIFDYFGVKPKPCEACAARLAHYAEVYASPPATCADREQVEQIKRTLMVGR